jgi:trimeric autotransporter adhesin
MKESAGTCEKAARPHFSEKILKPFRSDLERKGKDRTPYQKNILLMNKKFLRGAALFIIVLALSNLSFLAQVSAQTNTFYGVNAGTADGDSNSGFGYAALHFNTGSYNTACGAEALLDNTTGGLNTAIGYRALHINTGGTYNTASSASALESNTTGGLNTASGYQALYSNTIGGYNTASGVNALLSNTEGGYNTASGVNALFSNTTGTYNMASGYQALYSNTIGGYNTASGVNALLSNTTGAFNAANGVFVLYNNTTGNFNTANGPGALFSNTTGSNNVALGATAGFALTTGSNNICIGAGVNGVAGESNTTRIRNVYTTVANGRAVYVNADNKIGTLSSSRRFKHDIQPMDRSSETLFSLKPVTFRYKKDADPSQALSFGLIAEDVAEVSPELITRDEEGKPQTVRYEAVNAMLLNEFLKEHKTIAELKSTIAQQQKEIQTLLATVREQSAQIQKVSARLAAASPSSGGLEADNAVFQTAFNDR